MKKICVLFVLIMLVIPSYLPARADDSVQRPPITATNAASVTSLGVLDAGEHIVMALAFSPDGKFLLSSHPKGVIQEWDLATGKSTQLKSPSGSWVRAITYSPDGTQIASGDDKDIIIWDAKTKTQESVLKGHKQSVARLVYSPDGKVLASGAWDGTVALWDIATGKKLKEMKVKANAEGLVFSPDGKILAESDGNTAGINLWDVETGKSLKGITLEKVYPDDLAFNMDGTLLAGPHGGKIYVWDVKTSKVKYKLEGHKGIISDVVFSPVSSVLLSGGSDDTVRLWDTERGSGFSPLKSNVLSITRVVFSSDGSFFASGSDDGFIHLWGVSDPLSFPEPEVFKPKAGHWTGGTSSINVAFDIADDGNIKNFHWVYTIGTTKCTIDLNKQIDVKDLAFAFGPDAQRIEGKFRSATSLIGRSNVTQCGNYFIFSTGGPPTWWVHLSDK
jgi:WD40 repeat protein